MQFGNVLTFKLRMPDDPAIPFIELPLHDAIFYF